jgi:hypothetical protein
MKKRRRCHHCRDRLPIAYLWDISGTNMSQWPCDRYFVQLKNKNQLSSLWNTFYTESPRNITNKY